MKHLKRWICLFSLLLLLTLAACGNTGEQGAVVTPTVSPTVGVEETFSPSQQPSGEPKASEAPVATQQPTQSQDRGESAPAVAKPAPTPKVNTCYLSIDCKTILGRMEDLAPGKESLVPSDGVILSRKAISFEEGESVFDVLLRATRTYGIHLEYEYTPGFGSHYIEGINNLYEFDCGAGSGWMYYVNGVKPNYGVSKYTVKNGDVIEFKYTCDLGFDL